MLSGRLAFVSGGGSGLGRAISKVLAREGAAVTVADLNDQAAAETIKVFLKSTKENIVFFFNFKASFQELPGTDHMACKIDVASYASVENSANQARWWMVT